MSIRTPGAGRVNLSPTHFKMKAYWQQRPSVDSQGARTEKVHVMMSLPVYLTVEEPRMQGWR
jgi:hypothetical protein